MESSSSPAAVTFPCGMTRGWSCARSAGSSIGTRWQAPARCRARSPRPSLGAGRRRDRHQARAPLEAFGPFKRRRYPLEERHRDPLVIELRQLDVLVEHDPPGARRVLQAIRRRHYQPRHRPPLSLLRIRKEPWLVILVRSARPTAPSTNATPRSRAMRAPTPHVRGKNTSGPSPADRRLEEVRMNAHPEPSPPAGALEQVLRLAGSSAIDRLGGEIAGWPTSSTWRVETANPALHRRRTAVPVSAIRPPLGEARASAGYSTASEGLAPLPLGQRPGPAGGRGVLRR